MSKRKLLIEHFSEPDVVRLSEDEVNGFEKLWLSVFCNYSKSERSEIYLEQFKWHTFSYKKYISITGKDAEEVYSQQISHNYIVLPEFQAHEEEVAFSTSSQPTVDLAQLLTDFYVFPKNMAWTMAFTHEHGWLGPYFAKHPNYVKLNKHNIQAYVARQKGW